ncbi:MAG: hypothetical protein AAFO69_13575, partial [Bacteroidota bacterium]
YSYDASIFYAFPEGGFEAFNQYLISNNQLASDTVEASVLIRFDVHHSGRINDPRFVRRYQQQYDEYALKLLLEGPKWSPAVAHGAIPVSSVEQVRIDF